jgi:hypothetical protein
LMGFFDGFSSWVLGLYTAIEPSETEE